MIKRISAAWQVLTGKKYWVFTQYRGEYLQHISEGWKESEGRQIALSVHKAFKRSQEAQEEAHVEAAQKIVDGK